MENQNQIPAQRRVNSLTSLENIWDAKRPIEFSKYRDELTSGQTLKTLDRLRVAFPVLEPNYFDTLMERLINLGFTDQRLIDAVNNTIDNCKFPRPAIADIVSFDHKFRVYRYDELLKLVDDTGVKMENYRAVRLHPDQQKPVWVHVDDGKWLPIFIKNEIEN